MKIQKYDYNLDRCKEVMGNDERFECLHGNEEGIKKG